MGMYSLRKVFYDKITCDLIKKICLKALIFSMPFIISGCSYIDELGNDKTVNVSNEVKPTITQSKKNGDKDKNVKNTSKSNQNKDKKPTVSPQKAKKPTSSSAKQPDKRTESSEDIKLDSFESLSNAKLSWWYKTNNDNTRSVPSDVSKLLTKYDGIFLGDTSRKVLYLTFDEGYENGYTPKILDILKENDVKAVFFITGAYLNGHSDLVKRMLDEGHEVGNHTVNHPSMPSLSTETLKKEILDLEKKFEEKFNKGMRFFRPPSGEYSEKTLAVTKSLGYKTVFWSFHYLDYDVNNQKGTDFAYNTVMKGLHNGSVMLLHAVSKDNTEALDKILKDAMAQGYEFKLLEQ